MNNKYILVVDDDPSLRELFQIIVESFGFISETADNGGQALTMFVLKTYDAVLLDYMLPDMNGLTVLQHIKQVDRSIPVVILTGHTDEQVAERAIAMGARACLYKPFDYQDLEKILKDLLRTSMPEHVALP